VMTGSRIFLSMREHTRRKIGKSSFPVYRV
jgi:hypothetical protein